MSEVSEVLEARIEIAASPAAVWELVSDVRRMCEWSPQVTSTRLRQGFDEVAIGTQFTNRNSLGDFQWTTHAEIVRFEVDREVAFRIEENWAIWSFHLEPNGTGTTLIQRRTTPEGISELSHQVTDRYLGGQEPFTKVLIEGMGETLEKIRLAAEGATVT